MLIPTDTLIRHISIHVYHFVYLKDLTGDNIQVNGPQKAREHTNNNKIYIDAH